MGPGSGQVGMGQRKSHMGLSGGMCAESEGWDREEIKGLAPAAW